MGIAPLAILQDELDADRATVYSAFATAARAEARALRPAQARGRPIVRPVTRLVTDLLRADELDEADHATTSACVRTGADAGAVRARAARAAQLRAGGGDGLRVRRLLRLRRAARGGGYLRVCVDGPGAIRSIDMHAGAVSDAFAGLHAGASGASTGRAFVRRR